MSEPHKSPDPVADMLPSGVASNGHRAAGLSGANAAVMTAACSTSSTRAEAADAAVIAGREFRLSFGNVSISPHDCFGGVDAEIAPPDQCFGEQPTDGPIAVE